MPQIVRGDARALDLPDESVDLIVTSPPYFGLRSYQDGGEHYDGQIGAEATPAEFIAALIACTREWMRVLKPAGSIFVNLGDKYGRRGGDKRQTFTPGTERCAPRYTNTDDHTPQKSLMLLPERYRIAAVDELGLIARAVIVWSKPNGLPESVTDRVRRSHEDWVHLTKAPRYFASIDEIREPHAPAGLARRAYTYQPGHEGGTNGKSNGPLRTGGERPANPLGKLPGSVWEIATQPLKVPAELGVDHFAAFPMEWPRRLILGWSPSGVCGACGFLLGSSYDYGMLGVRRPDHRGSHQEQERSPAGAAQQQVLRQGLQLPVQRPEQGQHDVSAADHARVRGGLEAGPPDGAEKRLLDGAPARDGRAPGTLAGTIRSGAPQERDQDGQPDRKLGAPHQADPRPVTEATPEAVPLPTLQRADPDVRNPLSCPHCGSGQVRPSLIADPFGGTGTTALVATMLGRTGISVDLSEDYCRLARWRCSDPKQRERASRAAGTKPAKQLDRRPPEPGTPHLWDQAE
jgi:DNA modification methylase